MFTKYGVVAAAIAATMMCLSGSAVAREETSYFYGCHLAKYCAAPDQTTDYLVCVWFVMARSRSSSTTRLMGFPSARRT